MLLCSMVAAWPGAYESKPVSLLAVEAEYIATVHASKSAVWLQTLLCKLHLINNSNPIDLHVDN